MSTSALQREVHVQPPVRLPLGDRGHHPSYVTPLTGVRVW